MFSHFRIYGAERIVEEVDVGVLVDCPARQRGKSDRRAPPRPLSQGSWHSVTRCPSKAPMELLKTSALHGTDTASRRFTPRPHCLVLHQGTGAGLLEDKLPCQVHPCFLPSAERGSPVSYHSQISILQKLQVLHGDRGKTQSCSSAIILHTLQRDFRGGARRMYRCI